MLGIFWVYQGQVFGRARPLSEGSETCPGRLDSPDEHVSLWESRALKKPSPALADLDYSEVPRGRVVFSIPDQRAIIYLDESLSGAAVRNRIRKFFDLRDTPVQWEYDPHYTTDPDKFADLLDREFGDD